MPVKLHVIVGMALFLLPQVTNAGTKNRVDGFSDRYYGVVMQDDSKEKTGWIAIFDNATKK